MLPPRKFKRLPSYIIYVTKLKWKSRVDSSGMMFIPSSIKLYQLVQNYWGWGSVVGGDTVSQIKWQTDMMKPNDLISL